MQIISVTGPGGEVALLLKFTSLTLHLFDVDFLRFDLEMIGRGEERKECDTFEANHKNSDPEKPDTSLFCKDADHFVDEPDHLKDPDSFEET